MEYFFHVDNSSTNVISVLVKGTKTSEDAFLIIVNGLQATIDDTYTWHKTINLSSGMNVVTVTAKDTVGNESIADTRVFYLDNTSHQHHLQVYLSIF